MEPLSQDHLESARMLAPAPSPFHFVGEVLLCLGRLVAAIHDTSAMSLPSWPLAEGGRPRLPDLT